MCTERYRLLQQLPLPLQQLPVSERRVVNWERLRVGKRWLRKRLTSSFRAALTSLLMRISSSASVSSALRENKRRPFLPEAMRTLHTEFSASPTWIGFSTPTTLIGPMSSADGSRASLPTASEIGSSEGSDLQTF